MKALVHENKVVQVEAQEFPVHPSMQWLDCPEDVKTGWSYIDSQFIAPPVETGPTIEELRASAIIGPMELADKLMALGMFDAVNDWTNAQGGQISWAWNRATQFERLHPMVVAAQVEFGWTDEQTDALFGIV